MRDKSLPMDATLEAEPCALYQMGQGATLGRDPTLFLRITDCTRSDAYKASNKVNFSQYDHKCNVPLGTTQHSLARIHEYDWLRNLVLAYLIGAECANDL